MSKLPYIDYDFDFDTIRESKLIHTDCAAITILNQGNCTVSIDNNGSIPVNGGLVVLYQGFGIPRLTRKVNIVFQDDNTAATQVKEVSIVRTIIKSVCYE
jgi:hypothetical protein